MNYVRSCVNVEDNIDVQECPKYYMEFNQSKVSFDPEFELCSDIYADINNSIETLCNNEDNSDACTFNLSNIQKSNPDCFMLNRCLIEYTCEGSLIVFYLFCGWGCIFRFGDELKYVLFYMFYQAMYSALDVLGPTFHYCLFYVILLEVICEISV